MKKFLLMASVAISMIVASCGTTTPPAPELPVDKSQGQVKLSLKSEGSFEIVTPKAATKATTLPEVDANNFKVEVYSPIGALIANWDKFSEAPEFISLTAAKGYKIVAYNTKQQTAAFDAPYYYGETTFDIEVNKITAADIVAKLANTMISVTPSEAFKTYYGENYQFFVRNDEYLRPGDPELVINPGETRSGFIKAAPYTLVIKAGNTIQQRYVEVVNAQEHHIIVIDVKAVGSAGVTITIDKTVVTKNVDVTVPGDEEDLGNGGKPKPDQPGGGEDPNPNPDPEVVLPDVQLDGGNIDQEIIISNATDINQDGICTKPVKANVVAESGIENLIVTIQSPDLGPDMLIAMFGGESFDMANMTPELEAGLVQLGLIAEGAVIKGAKAFSFDVTPFMGLLQPNAVTHNFKIKVIDSKNNVVEKTLTVRRTE